MVTQVRVRAVPVRKAVAAAILTTTLLISCYAPTATFIPVGSPYGTRIHRPEDILVYLSPNKPDQPYKVVGSIVVVPPAGGSATMDAYVSRLREKAAEMGVDGVVNVAVKPRDKTQATGMCIYGTPYYSQNSYTVFDIQGDAFVWADSATTQMPHTEAWAAQSQQEARPSSTSSDRTWWVALVMVGVVGLLVLVASQSIVH